MSETFSVPVTQHDFIVIRASLIHSVEFWRHILETGEFPEGFDEGKARNILEMNTGVLEKIEMLLTMKPLPSHNVGVER